MQEQLQEQEQQALQEEQQEEHDFNAGVTAAKAAEQDANKILGENQITEAEPEIFEAVLAPRQVCAPLWRFL